MGLDLTLVPNRYPEANLFLGHTRIDLDRNYYIFEQICNTGLAQIRPVCKPKPLPDNANFAWYSDTGLDYNVKEDPYGVPLTYVTAKELSKVQVPDEAGAWNKAVFEFIKHLPPNTMIVLWWH